MIKVEDVIKKIEEDEKPRRDKTVLIMAAKLIYYCALKPGELIDLKIKDVQDKDGEIVHNVIINKKKKKEIELNEDIRSLLQSYIDYLKKKGYKISPNSPLIPLKGKSKYRYKKFSRHLCKYIEEKKLDKLRQAGITNFYNTNSNFSEFDEDDKLKKTAEYAHCSKRHINGILKGKIPSNYKLKAYKMWDALLEIDELSQIKKDIRILKELEILTDNILKDCIDTSIREYCEKLKIRLRDRIQELKNKPPEPVRESKGIIGHTNINFLDLLKDEIDDLGQD